MRQRQALAHIEYVPQKSPIYTAKEPYIYRKRALHVSHKSPIHFAKEPYIQCTSGSARGGYDALC